MGSKILLGGIWISGNVMKLEIDIENYKEYMILTASSKQISQLCDAPKTER